MSGSVREARSSSARWSCCVRACHAPIQALQASTAEKKKASAADAPPRASASARYAASAIAPVTSTEAKGEDRPAKTTGRTSATASGLSAPPSKAAASPNSATRRAL